MISLLVPVYNTNVVSLITELSRQLKNLNVEGEILVFDDYSSLNYRQQNWVISSFENVSYKELDENHGRTAIRKLLASHARYEWLLFLDGDSQVDKSDFIQCYIDAVKKGHDVYVGGRTYPAEPADCSKRLHWTYGVKREAARGNTSALHSNNFCISRDVFLQLTFPHLPGYGHEDTWLQLELDRMKKRIVFIGNPVQHDGLEDSITFLKKTKNALSNLLLLSTVVSSRKLRKINRLYNFFYWQKKFRLANLTILFLKGKINKIESNLQSCNPSLFEFDLYRLYYLIELENNTTQFRSC